MGNQPAKINLIPSVADLLFSSILLFIFFSASSGLLSDGDTGYHIRAGEHIITTLSVPKWDIFSYHTPPLPWTSHEWLAEVIMAGVHQVFGLTGIVAFFALLLASSIVFLFKVLRSYGAPTLLATAITLLACSASQIHWLARPHVFSFLLMIFWHQVLENWRSAAANRLYLLPLSMLFWVNLHGGFIVGFFFLGAYLAGSLVGMLGAPLPERNSYRVKIGQLSVTTGACLLACLCNPSGYHILFFPVKLVSDRFIMDHVTEFLSPNFHEVLSFRILLLLLVALWAVSKQKVEATELILVLCFTNMALYSARYIPLFALVMAPVLLRHSQQLAKGADGKLVQFLRKRFDNVARMDARATGYVWPALALLSVLSATVSGQMHHSFDPKIKAVAATEFLIRERIAGNMFNDDEFGDYLIYRSYPRYKVFFDGRSDMYGAEKLKEYLKITNFEPGWEGVLDKYGITWVFYKTDSSLSRFLLNRKGWVLIYSDEVASIFVKALPQYQYLTTRYHPVLLAEAATHIDAR
jgi:hypothetical protein